MPASPPVGIIFGIVIVVIVVGLVVLVIFTSGPQTSVSADKSVSNAPDDILDDDDHEASNPSE